MKPKYKVGDQRTSEQCHAKQLVKYRNGKRCTYCKQIKPVSEFYLLKSGYLTSRCRDCDTDLAVKWQRARRYRGENGIELLDARINRLESELSSLKALRKAKGEY